MSLFLVCTTGAQSGGAAGRLVFPSSLSFFSPCVECATVRSPGSSASLSLSSSSFLSRRRRRHRGPCQAGRSSRLTCPPFPPLPPSSPFVLCVQLFALQGPLPHFPSPPPPPSSAVPDADTEDLAKQDSPSEACGFCSHSWANRMTQHLDWGARWQPQGGVTTGRSCECLFTLIFEMYPRRQCADLHRPYVFMLVSMCCTVQRY